MNGKYSLFLPVKHEGFNSTISRSMGNQICTGFGSVSYLYNMACYDLHYYSLVQTFNEARRNRGDPLLAPSMANPHLQRFPLFLEHQEYIVFKGKDVITTGAGNESDADEGADDQSNVDEGADDQSDADEGADDKAEQFQVEVTSRHDKSEQRQVKVPSRIGMFNVDFNTLPLIVISTSWNEKATTSLYRQ